MRIRRIGQSLNTPQSTGRRSASTDAPDLPGGDSLELMRRNANAPDQGSVYDRLARQGPLIRITEDKWLTVGYEVSLKALTDRRFGVREMPPPADRTRWDLDLSFNRMNAPEHGRLRSVVAPVFSTAALTEIARQVERDADRLVLAAVQNADGDFVRDVAEALPLATLRTLLGVPVREQGNFVPLVRILGAALDGTTSPAEAERLLTAWEELRNLLTDLLRSTVAVPERSLLAALRRAGASRISGAEAAAVLMLVATAGYETTAQAIAGGAHALARYPQEWSKLRNDPALVPQATREILRYACPVLAVARVVLADATLDGRRLRAGQEVIVALGAASRDPSVFAAPHRFVVDRTFDTVDLAFAHGAHRCIGQRLAVLEIGAILQAMLNHLRAFEIKEDPVWLPGSNLRGLVKLPLAFGRR